MFVGSSIHCLKLVKQRHDDDEFFNFVDNTTSGSSSSESFGQVDSLEQTIVDATRREFRQRVGEFASEFGRVRVW